MGLIAVKYFHKLLDGLNPRPVLREIEARPELWQLIQARQAYEGSSHKDTETIVLRGPVTLEGIFDNLDVVDYPWLKNLSALQSYLVPIFDRIEPREIGRVMLVRLKAGGQITPHTDEGAYARYYARFHAPLSSTGECLFNCGDDVVHMAPGSLWWFNHQVEHSVSNAGPDRIHLILDATAKGFTGALAL